MQVHPVRRAWRTASQPLLPIDGKKRFEDGIDAQQQRKPGGDLGMPGQHQYGQLANDEPQEIGSPIAEEYMPVRIIPNQESDDCAQSAQGDNQKKTIA
ncbi:hypothetical protein D3C85_1336730 [compost metagenome]